MKLLYFDVETTGLDLSVHSVFQVSGIIQIDGEVKEEFNLFAQPPKGSVVSKKALEVTGKTMEDLRSYTPMDRTYRELCGLLGKHVDKYDPKDKLTPVAYNGKFDLDFLNKFFVDNDDKYFGSWQNWQLIDPLPIVRWLIFTGKMPQLENHKLETVCKYFGIEIEAHDALSDIRATRELVNKLGGI